MRPSNPVAPDLYIILDKYKLTNYITQTLFCIIFFNWMLNDIEFTRKEIFLFVVIVWLIQLIWSKYWLGLFSHGPLEFVWRKVTYFK